MSRVAVLSFVATACSGTLSNDSAWNGIGTMNHKNAIEGRLHSRIRQPNNSHTAPATQIGIVQPSSGPRYKAPAATRSAQAKSKSVTPQILGQISPRGIRDRFVQRKKSAIGTTKKPCE